MKAQKQEASMPKPKIKQIKSVLPQEADEKKRSNGNRKHRCYSDLAADDTLHYVDHYWPNALKLFPHDRGMNLCDKFYPNAVGGPLWIDEESNNESRDFKHKKEVMKEQGLRYIVIMRGYRESDILELVA